MFARFCYKHFCRYTIIKWWIILCVRYAVHSDTLDLGDIPLTVMRFLRMELGRLESKGVAIEAMYFSIATEISVRRLQTKKFRITP